MSMPGINPVTYYTHPENYSKNWIMYGALQDTTINLDMAGAYLEMGIYRAAAIGIAPTIYNLATWYNGGVQTIQAIKAMNVAGYGAGIVGLLIEEDRAPKLVGYGDSSFISNEILITQEEADLVFALRGFDNTKIALEGRNFQNNEE
jgi:hypothetical protein